LPQASAEERWVTSRLAVILTIAALLAGCIDRTRVNDTCTWSDAVSGPLDLRQRADREHLRADAEIANELMVRFGDVHGPHRPDLERPYREQCMRSMIDTITARHAVTRAQFTAAERERIWWADVLLVFLPMAMLGAAGSDYIARRVCRGFDPEDRAVATIAVIVLSFLAAGLTLGVTNVWAFAVEGWRLRNGHVSNRAFLIPIVTHGWACAIGAVALCLTVGVLRLTRTPLSAAAQRPYDNLRAVSLRPR
jgi:hypothetical protein